jgi:type I restriction enzyme S subunit
MTDRLDLPRRYRNQLEALLREHVPDAEVWAYGSLVNGRSHGGSDLDLVLRSPTLEPLGHEFLELVEALEQSNLPILVQAHDWARLPESSHREIERDYVVVQKETEQSGVTTKWHEVPLGEVIELKRGYDLSKKDRVQGSVPVVSSSGVSDWHSEAKVAGPGVVTGRYGTIGEVYFVEEDFWPLNTALYVRDFKGNDPRFISYFLRVLDFSVYSDKAAVPGVNRNHLHQAIVRYPADVEEQRAIAGILGALDDKIELNRLMNETLELMARALFQSWFVDFEPVRAKMKGREPYLPPELWDLFPDRLVDSELGEIPEGWEVKTLRDCIDVARGLSYKGSGLSSEGTPMHNLNSIYEGGGYKDDGIKYYSGDFRDRHVTEPGDVIVANTEQGHGRLLIGFAAIVPKRFGNRGLFSHHIYRIRPKGSAGLSHDFVCHLLNTQAMHGTVSGFATGTTVNMLPVDALRITRIVVPPTQLVAAFSGTAQAKRMKQEFLIEQSRALSAQRDVLLPQLVSGELQLETAGQ